ncbi:MAG: hypothetical protein HRT36_00050 [Alphaproteobacteria bacterium]|nr:hypothetical protein [Alphaproteobacteria bacterium]
MPVSLGQVMSLLEVNHDGKMYQMVRGEPVNVSGLARGAERTCQLLGISPHVCQEACQVMGTALASALYCLD